MRCPCFLVTTVLFACGGAERASDSGTPVDASVFDAGTVDGGDASELLDASTDAASDGAAPDALEADWPPLPECRMGYSGAPLQEHLFTEGRVGSVGFRLWRCYADQAAGRSALYRADRFELTIGATAYRVTTEAIEYENTHHNWEDSLVGTHPTAILHWESRYDPEVGVGYFVWATDLEGGVLLEETPIPRE